MSNLKNNKIFRVFFSVTGVIILSKLLGFVKQMITASVFGATIETDLISLSEGFIGNIKYLLVQTLVTSFVAIYTCTQEEDPRSAQRFAVDVGKAGTLIAVAVMAIIMIFAPQIAQIIAPSYSEALSGQLAFYLRLFAPALIFFVWAAVFHALLNANKRFIPGEMEGINQSAILLVLLVFLLPYLGVQVLTVAFLLYVVWNTVFLGIVSRHYWSLSRGNPFRNPNVRKLLQMAGPLLLGYSMVYINEIVGKRLVSGLEAGTVTALGYAAVLSNLVSTFIASFCSILFAYITSHISKGEDEKAADLVSRSAVLLIMVFLPISILTICCSEDIVTVVFGRGAFHADDVRTTAAALSGYAFMFVPLVLRDLFSRFQYGYQNSKTPMINSTVGIVTNIALSVALCPRLGVLGVTLAGSVSVCICGLLNAITAKRCNALLRFVPLLRQLPWLIVGGVVCALVAVWCTRTIPIGSALLRFCVTTICSGVAYLVAVSPLLWRVFQKRQIKKLQIKP